MSRILHFADAHLDRPFAGLPPEDAAARRRELFNAFRRCLHAAREHNVDLVTIGGDLWEDENVTGDSRASVAHELGQLDIPVAIICGNHDPYLPGGNYARTPWPANVHLFSEPHPTEFRLGDLSIWGVSWAGGTLTASFLDRFRAQDDGQAHVLLLHGTAQAVAHFAEQSAHCSFAPARLEEAGFVGCLAGHIHAGSTRQRVIYPGSPEPLGWGEEGRHCYALIDVAPGQFDAQLLDVNRRSYETRTVDCVEAAASAVLEQRLASALADDDPERVCLRVDLVGEVEPECEVDTAQLAAPHRDRYAALVIRDKTSVACDLDALSQQATARGRFVRNLRDRIAATEDAGERGQLELALQLGLRALDDRKELV